MILFSVLGIAIHAVFLYSVFDIYFKSPIIHGMTPYSTPLPAPANRLVLFVADGLRADKLFEVGENGESQSPFMRDIVLNTGAWGVSHTRVPTESRPGHVALTAGIYEDVSAVTKGWSENPVEFDSVFNESRYTWAWGSPDILPMFKKGAQGNVFIDTYSSDEEDFAGANPHHIDTWVFKRVEDFLEEATVNDTMKQTLSQGKIIFFLHLLGLDTTGHAYKPGSQEYIKNIQVVDSGIKHCVNVIENFYENDGKTAYVFTSDHGMTDWGSHGSGDNQETFTPLIAWGAGVRGPLGEGKDMYHDGLSDEWKLSHVKRVDVNQVDIAPLIATLIGIPFPVNSLGILPVEYLDTDWPHRALSLLTNARQVLAHYQKRMREKRDNTLSIFFWTFKELSLTRQAELMSMVDTLLKQNRYKDAIQVGLKIIDLSLKGLVYYQKHDRFALSFSVLLSFLGWMAYVIVLILRDYTSVDHTSLESSVKMPNDDFSRAKCIFSFGFIGLIITMILHVQNLPIMYYIYFLLPVLLWMLVTLRWDLFRNTLLYIERKKIFYKSIGLSIISFVTLELMVMVFFKREILSFILWLIAFWPFLTSVWSSHKKISLAWFATSIALSTFPMMPVVGRDSNYNLVILAGWLFVLAVALCARRPETGLILNNRQSKREPQKVVIITAAQVVILCIATYIVRNTSQSIANKEGSPILNQIVSWMILATSVILPLLGSQSVLTRLLNILTSLYAPYLLMSICHEGMFLLILCIQMTLWLFLEYHLSYEYTRLQDVIFVHSPVKKSSKHQIVFADLRRAFFYIFFIILAFFGTGNIASINSFEPSSVYCFLTVFSPFIMGFLILLKVLIPFIIVSCVFRAILVCLKVSPRALFLLILLMSDFMGLHFFFLVKDTGSWLEIGTSLSHYIISMTIIIFIMFLYGLAWIFTTCSATITLSSFKIKRHSL